ncbi:hypothetical protein [Nocardioides sp. Iso805N]|uniref:hypothetical protein n=1 Tax=Nocardioides sp. Iso805N TaxID=1283287 RepID=UPI0012FBFBEF|nr:hypothetical protein [Nocardioides sp. Iso805N]
MFRSPTLKTAGLLAALATVSTLSACGQGNSSSATPAPSPALSTAPPNPAATVGADGGPVRPLPGSGQLGSGFVTPSAPPAPGGTLSPSPGSWSQVHPPTGYRVALISTGDKESTKLRRVVAAWAKGAHVTVTYVPAGRPAGYLADIQRAIDLSPDLVISVGQALADPLTVTTADHLDQKFLVLGAELAEPTYNVTAAVWQDSSYRGGNDGTVEDYDPTRFTTARINKALVAAVAAAVSGYSGYVVRVS